MAFAQRLENVTPDGRPHTAASEALIFVDILRLVREEAWPAMAIACLAAMAVVLLAFRSWADLAALAMSEAAAIFATLGTLAVLGMRLSFFNIVVFPLLAGLGVNYGIHVLHRCREEGLPATRMAGRIVRPVGSAAATTAAGFAGLLFATHPGLWSLGFTAAVGISFTLLSCLFLLPGIADAMGLLRRPREASAPGRGQTRV
jgi:hypothetical protein